MTYRVLVTCPNLVNTIDLYRQQFVDNQVEIVIPDFVQQLTEAELLDIIDQFDGVIAGDDPFTAKVMEKGTRLKVIAKWGVGVDGIDLGAAERLGIPVCNTPGAFSNEVADMAIGYLVMLARQLHIIDSAVRTGGWAKPLGTSLAGKNLGVIGLGNIGKAIGRRGSVMGMNVLGYDVYSVDSDYLTEVRATQVELSNLLSEADFIVLCCSLTPDNHHLLNEQAFAKMKTGVRIVNLARGPLIDQSALVAALESGKVIGAALDVFEEEPLPTNDLLRQFDSCIFGTHNSSNTKEAVLRVNEQSILNLFQGLGIETI